MTLLYETESVRSDTTFIPVIAKLLGIGLLVVGAVTTAISLLAIAEHFVTSAVGTLAVDALKPFFG